MSDHRLFVSIDMPTPVVEAVGTIQQPIRDLPGIRPVAPDQSHVTVKFLGDVPTEAVDTVTEHLHTAVTEANVDPFTAQLGGLGVFPSWDYISVIWLGVPTGGSAIEALHEAIETRVVEAGYPAESHEFTPHVTIARMDSAAAKERVQRFIREEDPLTEEFTVKALHLKESHLVETGPVYQTRATIPLPGGDSSPA